MAIKRNKESPSGQPKDPTKPPKIVVNDPAESPAPPPPPETPSMKPPTDGGGGSGGGGGNSGGSSGGASPGPSKKVKAEKKGNPIAEFQQFVHEVLIEFRKISWPEFSQVVRETWSVLFLVAVITLMVLGFDWVLGNIVFGPLEHFARVHGGGIGVR